MTDTDQRWPRWIYRDSEEPDYRFTFANERTFLAWIRTALALIASGVAVDALDLGLTTYAQRALSATLMFLGVVSAVSAWTRWARAEHALRRHRPLPSSWAAALLAITTVVLGIAILVVAR
jgi:putative membrane protein